MLLIFLILSQVSIDTAVQLFKCRRSEAFFTAFRRYFRIFPNRAILICENLPNLLPVARLSAVKGDFIAMKNVFDRLKCENILDVMIETIPASLEYNQTKFYKRLMRSYLEIVKIEKESSHVYCDDSQTYCHITRDQKMINTVMNYGLDRACYYGNLECVKAVAELKQVDLNWIVAIHRACEGGFYDIYHFCKQRCSEPINHNRLFNDACLSGNAEFVIRFFNENEIKITGISPLTIACNTDNSELFDFLTGKYKKSEKWWQKIFVHACGCNSINILKSIIEKFDKKLINKGLARACYCQQKNNIELLLSHGADYCDHCEWSLKSAGKHPL